MKTYLRFCTRAPDRPTCRRGHHDRRPVRESTGIWRARRSSSSRTHRICSHRGRCRRGGHSVAWWLVVLSGHWRVNSDLLSTLSSVETYPALCDRRTPRCADSRSSPWGTLSLWHRRPDHCRRSSARRRHCRTSSICRRTYRVDRSRSHRGIWSSTGPWL